jgi:hypothetical protein
MTSRFFSIHPKGERLLIPAEDGGAGRKPRAEGGQGQMSPFLKHPARFFSSSRRGMLAAEVFPYRSILTRYFSLAMGSLFCAASMMRELA